MAGYSSRGHKELDTTEQPNTANTGAFYALGTFLSTGDTVVDKKDQRNPVFKLLAV